MTSITPKHIYNCNITRLPPASLKMKRMVLRATPIPPSVDLRPKMSPPYDQGALGSCTANALCGAFEYSVPTYMGSRLFLYYNERMLENTIPDDQGAFLSDGIKCMERYGICPETQWPYVISQFAVKPPVECYTEALKYHVVSSSNIPCTLGGMKHSLADGFPFVVGIKIYASFESAEVARTGIVPMPKPNEDCFGGHAVLVCGYDDAKQMFIVRNSWGPYWGDCGYFYLPYNYLSNPSYSSDMWNITAVNVPSVLPPAPPVVGCNLLVGLVSLWKKLTP